MQFNLAEYIFFALNIMQIPESLDAIDLQGQDKTLKALLLLRSIDCPL
jgi:hypothetical protein